MTFYIGITTDSQALLAIDNRVTHLNAAGTQPDRYAKQVKLHQVNAHTVAVGSGAIQFTETWCAKVFPSHLRDAVDLDSLMNSSASLQQALASDHKRLRAAANPAHDTSATLLLAGVSNHGEPFMVATHSPRFDIRLVTGGVHCVTSRIRNEEALQLPSFMDDLHAAIPKLPEHERLSWLRAKMVDLTIRASAIDDGVGEEGQIAVVEGANLAITTWP